MTFIILFILLIILFYLVRQSKYVLTEQIFQTERFMFIISQVAVASGCIQITRLVTNTGFVCLCSDTICGTLLNGAQKCDDMRDFHSDKKAVHNVKYSVFKSYFIICLMV